MPMTDRSMPHPKGLKALRLQRQWSMAHLADLAESSTSTINRLEKGEVALDVNWLEKFSQIFGVDWYAVAGREPPWAAPAGFSDDATPFVAPDGHPFEHANFGPNRDLWDVTSAALDAIGLSPGDQVLVDMTDSVVASVATGDAVIVQHIDPLDPMKAHTLMRMFIEPDLFVTNSRGNNEMPLNRQRDDVRIKGKIIKRFSPVATGRLR